MQHSGRRKWCLRAVHILSALACGVAQNDTTNASGHIGDTTDTGELVSVPRKYYQRTPGTDPGRRSDGSQPMTAGDEQIQLSAMCFGCLQAFCRERLLALPATSRYCCKPEVLRYINREVQCARFEHVGASVVEICRTHKSDWNICANLVLGDICRGCEHWPPDYDLDALFNHTPPSIASHGRIRRLPPNERDPSTPVVPVVDAHECTQDPVCDRHGRSTATQVGNYTMPAHIAKLWTLISHSPEFEPSFFDPDCGVDQLESPGSAATRSGESNRCTVYMAQLERRRSACHARQNCSATYVSMLALAEAFAAGAQDQS